jgi:hypothetical protein
MSLGTWTGANAVPDYNRRALRADVHRGTSRLAPRLALAAYLGLACYCVLSIFVGPAGLTAYRALEEREKAMKANLLDLGSLREALNGELESLRSDPDRAAREARGLGYLRKGETAVVLGERIESNPSLESGKILPFAARAGLSDGAIKAISLSLSLAILAFLCAPHKGKVPSRDRRRAARSRGFLF